jgi:hypothetical protein
LPGTLYTPTNRAELAVMSVFPEAVRVSGGEDEDVFQLGACRVTCRYWTRGGDFVSKQILGCVAAVEAGRLRSTDAAAVQKRVFQTQSVIGIVGPEDQVRVVAAALAGQFLGVLVDGAEAVLAEPGGA